MGRSSDCDVQLQVGRKGGRRGGRLGRGRALDGVGRAGLGFSEVLVLCLQSQTVEERHAVFEWDSKREVFAVRDLGSVNGVGHSSCVEVSLA